jgi:hypothetical protein
VAGDGYVGIESQTKDSKYRQAIDTIATLYGPVSDTEAMFTDLDLVRGALLKWIVM